MRKNGRVKLVKEIIWVAGKSIERVCCLEHLGGIEKSGRIFKNV